MRAYETYKDSGISWLGYIPSHWEVKRLGSYFNERRVKVSDKDFEPLSVTKLGIFPQWENVAKTNDGDNRKLVRKGDFVINSRSDRKGSSGVSELDGSVSLINIVLSPKETIVPTFCNYLLKCNSFIEEYYRIGRGIVADLWTTRYQEMKSMALAIPPLNEQNAIVAYLKESTESIDSAISRQQKMIDLLKERKQIIINEAVTHGLNPNVPMKETGIENLPQIPKHWALKRLGILGSFTKGSGISRDDLQEEGLPAILYGDIYTKYEISVSYLLNKISHKTASVATKITSGDILMTGSGETKEDIGKAVYYDGEDAFAGGDVIIFRQNSNNGKFISYLLNSFYSRFYKAATSKGEIVVHTYPYILKNLFLPIPPIDEQNIIAKILDINCEQINAAILRCERLIELLTERKQIVINDVVTGKVKVI